MKRDIEAAVCSDKNGAIYGQARRGILNKSKTAHCAVTSGKHPFRTGHVTGTDTRDRLSALRASWLLNCVCADVKKRESGWPRSEGGVGAVVAVGRPHENTVRYGIPSILNCLAFTGGVLHDARWERSRSHGIRCSRTTCYLTLAFDLMWVTEHHN